MSHLSDSIVDKVIKTKKPVIVSDAMKDAEFQNAMSVMSLQLSSVMCVPLLERGNMMGAIYVGNSSVAHLFDESHLEVLTIFAAQASQRSACLEPRRASVKLIRITAPLTSSTSLPQLSQTSLVTRATEFLLQ